MDQFIFNTTIDVTLRDLETTKQGVGETFFEYMTRWKGKASRVINRPNEKDQIPMIIRNLLLTYNSRLLSSSISSFGELCDCGTRIRMPSTMDNWRKVRANLQSRRHMEEEQIPLKLPIS